MPISAILITLLGLVPFIGCGLGALAPHAGAGDPWLQALIAYAAVVLSFIGGAHWGMLLREADPPMRGARTGLAMVPLLFGWAAMVVVQVVAYWLALAVLIAGFILAIAWEHQAGSRVELPARYVWLRWLFTIVAVAMLTTVLTLRLLGQSIDL